MDEVMRQQIVGLLDIHRKLTLATLRPDGWPQATTVGYGNEGLNIYFLCGTASQKAANIAADDRVSLTIDDDPEQIMQIKGLSLAGRARRVTDRAEAEKAVQLLMQRYPAQHTTFPMPNVEDVRVFRVSPVVISVLDYSKGFGHTDLVNCDTEEQR